jgi:hypothetical protein
MELQPDFKELLTLLNSHKVEYLLVGGYALAFHGAPRATGDLDLWVKPDMANALRLLQALQDFGFGSTGLKASDFETEGQVIQLGVPPVRVDLITSASGINWDQAWGRRQPAFLGGVEVQVLGRAELVANKRAVNRTQDRADLEALGET